MKQKLVLSLGMVLALAGLFAVGGIAQAQVLDTSSGDELLAESNAADVLPGRFGSGPGMQFDADTSSGGLREGEGIPREHPRGGFGHHGEMMDTVADMLGLERDELIEKLQAGSTIADLAEEQGVALDDIVAALVEEHAERLAQQVADGKLTQEEADAKLAEMKDQLIARLSEPFEPGEGGPADDGRGGRGGKGHMGHGLGGPMIDTVADMLGLERDELIEKLEAGSTIADLAEEQGVALDDIVAALVEEHAERLAQQVADGKLTQEEADAKLAEMKDQLLARLSEPFEPGEGGPADGGRGGRGLRGSGL